MQSSQIESRHVRCVRGSARGRAPHASLQPRCQGYAFSSTTSPSTRSSPPLSRRRGARPESLVRAEKRSKQASKLGGGSSSSSPPRTATTRRAYGSAVGRFLCWCEVRGLTLETLVSLPRRLLHRGARGDSRGRLGQAASGGAAHALRQPGRRPGPSPTTRLTPSAVRALSSAPARHRSSRRSPAPCSPRSTESTWSTSRRDAQARRGDRWPSLDPDDAALRPPARVGGA